LHCVLVPPLVHPFLCSVASADEKMVN